MLATVVSRRGSRDSMNLRLIRSMIMSIAIVLLAIHPDAAGAQGPLAPEQRSPDQQEPPYEAQLMRLAEILGAVQYLRSLCNSDEGSLWRDEMHGILEAEAPTVIRRTRLIDRFNRGFDSFRSVYRTCTPAAITAIDRYMEEGADIARAIAARYGK